MQSARNRLSSSFEKYVIEKTMEFVKSRLIQEPSGHDWWHTYRVYEIALEIGWTENANLFIIQLAALLHDVCDYKVVGESVGKEEIVGDWLRSLGIDEETITHISRIIAESQFKGAKVDSSVSSIEGKVLQDADRIEAMGAIGIARTFAYGGYKGQIIHDQESLPKLHESFSEYKASKNTSINHFYEKLLLLKDMMNTTSGKVVAATRHEFMLNFLREFLREWECTDVKEMMGQPNTDVSGLEEK